MHLTIWRNFIKYMMLALIYAIGISGCNSLKPQNAKEAQLIEQGSWRIISLRQNGAMQPVFGTVTLTLSQSEAIINSDCAAITGRYWIEKGLSFDGLRLPAIACEEPLFSQQAALFANLNKAANWRVVQDGELGIFHDKGVELMRLSR